MHGTAVTRGTKFRLMLNLDYSNKPRIDITPYIPSQPSVSPVTQSEALQMARRVYGEQSRLDFPRAITSMLVCTTRRDRPWRSAQGCEQGPFGLTRPLVNLRKLIPARALTWLELRGVGFPASGRVASGIP